MRDLQGRLKSSGDIILTLESKIKQLSNQDTGDLAALLKQLRDSTEQQLKVRTTGPSKCCDVYDHAEHVHVHTE